MKTVLLMRHAKSSWKQSELQDFDRPLNKRGRKDAPRMGSLLREKGLVPQLILSSSAERARETVEGVTEGPGYRGEVRYFDSLYQAEPQVYLDLLQALPDHFDQVMVVGHNPGIAALLEMLTGEEDAMPTAAVAVVTLPVQHWQDLKSGVRGELVKVWRPKEL